MTFSFMPCYENTRREAARNNLIISFLFTNSTYRNEKNYIYVVEGMLMSSISDKLYITSMF